MKLLSARYKHVRVGRIWLSRAVLGPIIVCLVVPVARTKHPVQMMVAVCRGVMRPSIVLMAEMKPPVAPLSVTTTNLAVLMGLAAYL